MKNSIMEMKKYKIGDVLELQRGYDLPSSQMIDGNVQVAGSNGIIGSHNVARGNTPCITVGRSGSVGKVHFYEQPVWVHNTSLYVKDFKGNDPKYLFYFLRNLHLDEIFGKSSSVVPSLDRKVVHAMIIPFQDDIDKQKDIAHVLSLLDQKIALNRAINRNLATLAKQLYDYWFVQFDFPNEEGKPYKSSGGKMVWNDTLKKDIPEGWNVLPLFEAISVQYGFPFATEQFTEEITNVPVVRIRDILDGTTSAYSLEDTEEKYRLNEGDVLVGMDGNFHINFWHNNEAYLNQRCVRLRPYGDSDISSIQIMHSISPYIKAMEQNAKGSTVGHLSDRKSVV